MRKRMVAAAVVLALGGAAQADDWQDPATLTGLVGTYAGAPGSKILYVTLGGTDGFRASGPYTRFVVTGRYGTISIESGHYEAIASNPAIGPVISFFDAASKPIDTWGILAIKRDPTGQKIIGIELGPFDAGNTPQTVYRVGL